MTTTSTLDQFRGKSWSEVVVRHKIKSNEILLSEDNSYDLVRCRQCRRVVKSGFVDIHSKKCKQYQSTIPKNASSNGKITMAKYYYHIPPIDNSTNPELNPHKRITEPPHKKRKVNKNKTDNNTSPTLILPSCVTNSSQNKSNSIYNDLYHGLKPYTSSNKSKPKTTNKKLKLRFSRSRMNQNNNKTPPTISSSKSNDDMMNNQKQQQTSNSNSNSNSNNNNSNNNRHRFFMSAWEREEEIINEKIKQECSLSYVPCSGVYNAYAKTLDKYSQEYTTRGITINLKHYDKELNKMNSNAFFRPIIKSILHRNNYKEHGQQYEEFMALEDIIGISYNLPKKFSNGIIPPHEIKCVNKSQISLKSFIEDGKLQQHMQRDENDFYMKEQPYSPFKYINTNLHNKIIKLQLNIYRNKQIAYMQRKKQIEDQKKAIQQAQIQAQQQYRNHNRNINGAPIPLMTPRNVNVTAHPTHSTHTPPVPTPGPPIPSGPGSAGAIPISRTAYNALTKPYINGHSAHTHINRGRYNGRISAVNALAIPRQRYNGMINGVDVPSIPRQSSYSSNNSINTQQSHNTIASITSRNTHTSSIYNTSNRTGHINSINSHGGVGVPPAVSVPSLPMSGTPVPTPVLNIHHRGGPNSVGPGSVTTSVVPQAQYPSHLPTQTVPSPFVNSGRNSVGPPGQPPNMLRRDSINTNVTQGSHNSVPNINVYRGYNNRHNNGNNRGRSNSITPSAVNVNRNNVNINNHMNMVNNIIRPPRYDTANINVNTNDNGSHYNASPSDTQITNISALTQQTTPGPGSGVTPIPLTSAHLNINNSNNNPSPQSINSNHTNYTGVSQHSTSQMTYRGNNQSTGHVNNGIPLTNTSHRLYSAGAIVGPTDLIRNPTTDSEMYMPSIGC